MPSFGFWELTLIMFVALLVVGPSRLPQVAAHAGHWIGRIKTLATNFKTDLSREMDTEDLQKTIAAPREEIEKLGSSLQQTSTKVEREVRNLDPLIKVVDEQIEAGRFEADDANNEDADKRDENT